MAIRPVLRMGDPRLWQQARAVDDFDTPELHALIADMQANEAKAGVVRAKNAALGTVSNLANGELKSGNATLDGKELPSHVTQDAPVVPPKSK